MKRKHLKLKKPKGEPTTDPMEELDPATAAWLEKVTAKSIEEANRFTENINNSHGYERYEMLGDFRSDKEKYQSHMVIVVRKDELPNFSKMNAKAIRAWCEENDASPYLQRKGSNAIKALLWALRHWKNFIPKPRKPGEYKVLNSRKELPKVFSPLEQEAFWKTHRLSESLIKRLSGQELRDLGWKEHGQRVEGSKPIKTPKNPIRTEEGDRILITRASDIPDRSKLTHDEDADWYDEYEIALHLMEPVNPKDRANYKKAVKEQKAYIAAQRKKQCYQ
jgi:hypothetical protein